MPQLSPSTRYVLAHSSTGGTSPCRRHRVMVLGSNPGHGVYVYVRTATNWYELVRTGTKSGASEECAETVWIPSDHSGAAQRRFSSYYSYSSKNSPL